MQRQRGLTLLELLVVLAIMGFAMAGVTLSLRDNSQTQLDREAQRLIAFLEAARAQSRTSGIPLVWHSTPQGFAIEAGTLPRPPATEQAWLNAGTSAQAPAVVLGPEPIVAPASITLIAPVSAGNNIATRRIATDGLRPFQVVQP
jgi:general secretion pathway protein H